MMIYAYILDFRFWIADFGFKVFCRFLSEWAHSSLDFSLSAYN